MSIVGKTLIDEILEDKSKTSEITRVASPNYQSAQKEADLLYKYALEKGLQASRLQLIEQLRIPVVIISTKKFVIYNVILGEGVKLTGSLSLEIFEEIMNNIEDSENRKIIIIYYSKKGNILRSAYLFLGYLIEKHKVGILFVNGSIKEIFEIVDSLIEKGEFKPEEEDYIELEEITT